VGPVNLLDRKLLHHVGLDHSIGVGRFFNCYPDCDGHTRRRACRPDNPILESRLDLRCGSSDGAFRTLFPKGTRAITVTPIAAVPHVFEMSSATISWSQALTSNTLVPFGRAALTTPQLEGPDPRPYVPEPLRPAQAKKTEGTNP
jgi:hypothetical protein